MTEKFDAIVVGAGPAGTTAAYVMAKSGLRVVMLERGEFPGSKNVIGGVLYIKTLNDLMPGFWREAPLERKIVKHAYCLMGRREHTTITYSHSDEDETPNGYTILRSKFDRWYAKKAEEAGAVLVTKMNVTDLLMERGRTTGVRTDRGDLTANLVVVAEGANTMLCEKAGLSTKPRTNQMAVTVKEVIGLPSERIRERFGLDENDGAAIHYIGVPLKGMAGFGFVYTNRESISVGLGTTISSMIRERVKPHELLEKFKNEPSVEVYLRGGVVKEYQAHMIPEGGYPAMPKPYADNVMLVGDTVMLANPVTGEGADLAIMSGRMAGEVAAHAHNNHEYSKTLAEYGHLLIDSFAVRDMKKQAGLLHAIEENVDLMSAYPEIVNSALKEWFRVDGTTRRDKVRKIVAFTWTKRGVARMIKDGFTFGRRMV